MRARASRMSLPLIVPPLPSASLSWISCFSVAASLVVYSLRQAGTGKFASFSKYNKLGIKCAIKHRLCQLLDWNADQSGRSGHTAHMVAFLSVAEFHHLHNKKCLQVVLSALRTSGEQGIRMGQGRLPRFIHLNLEAICCCAAAGTDDILCTQARSSGTEARHLQLG